MKAIRRFNNNLVLCVDENGCEFIARGKGVGFHAIPYDIKLSQIERTYYDINPIYLGLISSLSEEIISISTKIVEHIRNRTDKQISSNLVFTLADHLSFAIQRCREGMNLSLPIDKDVEHLFDLEYETGLYGLELIRKEMKTYLPKNEAAYIALHIVNSEKQTHKDSEIVEEEMIEDIIKIIEDHFSIIINREDFNYSRFASHMHYLIKRSKDAQMIASTNARMFESLKENYRDTYLCSEKISQYFSSKLGFKLTDEEKMYLILHINRLCSRG